MNGKAEEAFSIFFAPSPRKTRARGEKKRAEGRLDKRVAPFPFPTHRKDRGWAAGMVEKWKRLRGR